MNETDPSPSLEEPARRPSFFSQVTDVITAPADVFTELRPLAPSPATGFAVVCIAAFLAILSSFTLLVAKGAMDDVMRRQQKAFEQAVEKGKMTAADASRGMEQMRGISPAIFVAIGAAAACIFTLVASLCWALIVFLGAKLLGGQALSFTKAYEITGLAYAVTCLGTIAASGLILLRDSLALPSGALFVEDFDPGNKMHNLLQALNPFSVWFVAVLGVALACSSGISVRKGLLAIVGFWVVKTLILVVAGGGQFA